MPKYTKEILEKAVKESISFAGVLRYLNLCQSGGTQAHLKKMIIRYGINWAHFTGQSYNKGKKSSQKRKWQEILIKNNSDSRESAYLLKRALIESGIKYQCVECKIENIYNNKEITLHVDHIDGDWSDNQKENLRFLCPNCHSQTSNFGIKNKKNKSYISKNIEANNYSIVEKKQKDKKRYCCSRCNTKIHNRAKHCKECHRYKERVTNWPSKEWLSQLIYMMPFTEIAKVYNVTDNTVRNWCRYYQLEIPKIPTGFWLRGISPTQRQRA